MHKPIYVEPVKPVRPLLANGGENERGLETAESRAIVRHKKDKILVSYQ